MLRSLGLVSRVVGFAIGRAGEPEQDTSAEDTHFAIGVVLHLA